MQHTKIEIEDEGEPATGEEEGGEEPPQLRRKLEYPRRVEHYSHSTDQTGVNQRRLGEHGGRNCPVQESVLSSLQQ